MTRPPGGKGVHFNPLACCENRLPHSRVFLAWGHHPDAGVQMLGVVPVKELRTVYPRRLEGEEALGIGGDLPP